MNVRKLMARLNPPIKPIPVGGSGTRFLGGSRTLVQALVDSGKYRPNTRDAAGNLVLGELALGAEFLRSAGTASRGGFSPDMLSAIDIAHALATIQNPMGRELFCHLWWPDGAARTFTELHTLLHRLLLNEYAARRQTCEVAELDFHILESTVVRWKAEDRTALHRAQRRRDQARLQRWPSTFPVYQRVVDAVLDELKAPNHCAVCEGRGIVWEGELQRDCSTCEATGTIPVSDRQRADAMGKRLATYQAAWQRPYEWLHRECWKQEGKAATQMRSFLFGEPGTQAAA